MKYLEDQQGKKQKTIIMSNSVTYLICGFVNLPPNNVSVPLFYHLSQMALLLNYVIALYLMQLLHCIQRIVNMSEKFMVKGSVSAERICDVMMTYNHDVMETWLLCTTDCPESSRNFPLQCTTHRISALGRKTERWIV